MFVSVYRIDTEDPKVCQTLLDASALHREVQSMFDATTEKYHVLHGVYDGFLLVKSDVKPIYDGIFELIQTVDMTERMSKWKVGDTFNFMVTTDPHKQGHIPGSKKKEFHYITDETKRLIWIKEKFADKGAEIVTVREISKENKLMGSKPNKKTGGNVNFTTWKYGGMLRITDVEKFTKLYSEGMGLKKAFGNGMVVLY